MIALQMLMAIAREADDSIRMKRLVPYLINLIEDTDSAYSRYAFNTLIDLFYLFIDPFKTEEDTNYYDMFL